MMLPLSGRNRSKSSHVTKTGHYFSMRSFFLLACLTPLAQVVTSQEINNIWQTTWDQSSQFTRLPLSSPIKFTPRSTTHGPEAISEININDTVTYQQMVGIGASLTDSSALVLNNLKEANWNNYWKLLNELFGVKPTSAGFNYIRVPIGASDFSNNLYSLDDVTGDISFTHFNISNAPGYLFTVLSDILSINKDVNIHILPWSPPGWMKDSGTMNGGTLLSQYRHSYATYLLKAVQGFESKEIPIHAVSIQNEPQNSQDSYPTCLISPEIEAQLGITLRSLLNANGLGKVKIVAYEHNWNDATTYPVQVLKHAPNAFSAVAFHCYQGVFSNQNKFHKAVPNKPIYMTECTGEIAPTKWWPDIKWSMNNIFIGSIESWAQVALMWNLVLDESGYPMLPGTKSCIYQDLQHCRPVATVSKDGSYSFTQDFYSMAHTSKAIIPKESGGPFGQRIHIESSSSLLASAYVVPGRTSTEPKQYTLVVLNQNDGLDNFNSKIGEPEDVTAAIGFRGQQAIYTFPVGVTTLWWSAP